MMTQKAKKHIKKVAFALMLLSLPAQHMSAMERFTACVAKAAGYVKNGGTYLFSLQGAKDAALAYCLGMGLTTIHELGHAITAKMISGSPIDITLGAAPSLWEKPYFQIGCFKLGGFNPATAFASLTNIRMSGEEPLRSAAVSIAGPICGALSSLGAWYLLKKNDNYPLCKAVAMYGYFNHTVGFAGLLSLRHPGSDFSRFVRDVKTMTMR